MYNVIPYFPSWIIYFSETCYWCGFSILICLYVPMDVYYCICLVIHYPLLYFLCSRLMPLLPVIDNLLSIHSLNLITCVLILIQFLCSNRHSGGSLIQVWIRSWQSKVSPTCSNQTLLDFLVGNAQNSLKAYSI